MFSVYISSFQFKCKTKCDTLYGLHLQGGDRYLAALLPPGCCLDTVGRRLDAFLFQLPCYHRLYKYFVRIRGMKTSWLKKPTCVGQGFANDMGANQTIDFGRVPYDVLTRRTSGKVAQESIRLQPPRRSRSSNKTVLTRAEGCAEGCAGWQHSKVITDNNG